MRRRRFCALVGVAVAWPLHGKAQQQASKVARIGLLETAPRAGSAKWRDALVAGLRERGFVEGRNVIVEYRWAEGNFDRLPAAAAELVDMKVDIIVAATPPAIQAAQRATSTIPIVMVRTSDPVALGFVASLARPGGNITGVSNINEDISTKWLELLRAAIPRLSRIAMLVNPSFPLHAAFLRSVQAAAQQVGVRVSSIQASKPDEIEPAFRTMAQERTAALIVPPDPFFFGQGKRIVELALQHRLPTVFHTREYAELGGLMSYGQNRAEDYYRAATYVDKILKGARPGQLPVEQPTKFELVVNLKAAKVIGLTVPKELLLRADQVIE
jgi:putative ABC transport system substrate-binding protein